jgi:hypothetical protein
MFSIRIISSVCRYYSTSDFRLVKLHVSHQASWFPCFRIRVFNSLTSLFMLTLALQLRKSELPVFQIWWNLYFENKYVRISKNIIDYIWFDVAAAEIWILIFVTVSTKKYTYYERTALFSLLFKLLLALWIRRYTLPWSLQSWNQINLSMTQNLAVYNNIGECFISSWVRELKKEW